ncbi:hypothetical protein [Saccharospirillum impatiens]|uniref:hypothetical protein n=1 Tax=Saccharospirillum impatiens TaxID=169438 RepID=UPI00041047CC|nr:hypothetical protein [Saccharospirillum impatiens]
MSLVNSHAVFRWLIPVWVSLILAVAGCNSEGNSSDDSSDSSGDASGQTDPDPNDDPGPSDPQPVAASIDLDVTNTTSGLELSWTTTGGGFTTINLCLAREAINDQFAQCSALTSGDYRPDVSSPLTLEALSPSARYWLQIEGERSGDAPVYSRVQVGVPLVPENADIGDAVEVVEETFFGTDKPRDLNRAGAYTLITGTSTDAVFWSSLGSEASTQYIAVEEPGGSVYEPLNLSLQAGLTKTLNVNDQLYFTAQRDEGSLSPTDIWVTDGTAEGTRRLVDSEVHDIAIPRYFVELDGVVGFVAYTSGDINTDRFYVIDEAASGGARQLADITPFTGGVGLRVIGFNGDLFISQTLGTGRRLLKVDAETLDVEPFWTIPNFTIDQRAPSNLTVTSDYLYFTAKDNDGEALWRTDGVSDPIRLFDPDPSTKNESDFQTASNPIRVGESVFFFTRPWDPDRNPPAFQSARQLAVATESGDVSLVWVPGLGDGYFTTISEAANLDMNALGDRLLFKSSILAPGDRQWWLTDGSAANTAPLQISGLPTDAPPSGPPHFFSADSQRGVWITDDDRERLYFVGRDPAQTQSINGSFTIIDNLVEVGGQLWFTAAAEFAGPISVWRIPQLEVQ